MSQSFANTGSFPLEWGLKSPPIDRWIWAKVALRLDFFKGYERFLRYPEPDQGAVYRMFRMTLIAVLKVRVLLGMGLKTN